MVFVIEDRTSNCCAFDLVAHFKLMVVSINWHLLIIATILRWCNPRMRAILLTKMVVVCVEKHILNAACFVTNWFLLLFSLIDYNLAFTFSTISVAAATSLKLKQWSSWIADNDLWSNTRVSISFCWLTSPNFDSRSRMDLTILVL